MNSVLSMTISQASDLIRKKVIKIPDLCKLCLQRIKKTKDLNAYISVTSTIAEEQAVSAEKRLQEGNLLGILDGIPIAIKDNWSTRGIKTTCASKMLHNYVPPYDATVVQRLLHSGAVITGKANLDEFAMGSATVDSYFGPTKNPWRSGLKYHLKRNNSSTTDNLDHTVRFNKSQLPNDDFFVAGGSSGGAAVSVASGSCFGAIASDTGGSTRNPAAFCGIVGLKPTYGLISRHGLIPLCNSLDVPGILTRSVDDAVILLNCLSGHDPLDSTTVKRPYTQISIPENISIKDIHFGIPKRRRIIRVKGRPPLRGCYPRINIVSRIPPTAG